MKEPRSHCPQNLILEIIGDRWTLLIIRDMMLKGKLYFREFLKSEEKIATNILTTRLKMLEEEGIIYKKPDPDHKQKIQYKLIGKGIDLFPILLENARWCLKYKKVDLEDAKRAKEFLEELPSGTKAVMIRLRQEHTGM